jgi:predicted RNA-binding protein with PUA domain
MKICGGYYWCDHCDEPAFGDTCHQCHRPATFKPTDSSGAPANVPPEFAAAAFAAMRRLVDAAPDFVHTPNSK